MKNYNTIEIIKQNIAILDFFRRYVGEPKRDAADDRFKINCPLHQDNNPSLTIWTGNNRWHCFGCGADGDIFDMIMQLKNIDIKEAIILLTKDFNLQIPQSDPKKGKQTIYNYTDSDGNLAYQVIREDVGEKRIRQRRPDGKGGWVWNLKGVEPLPYRLSELLKAIERDDTIYIAEGEKCADVLVALGFSVTTNSGGSGKWNNSHSKYFPPGTEVIIFPDNDNPGRNHAQQIIKELTRRGCKVKTIDLPGLSDIKTAKGTGEGNSADIADWLAAGHTKEELIQLSKEAHYWQLPETPPEETNKYSEWQALFQGTSYEIDERGYLCKIRETRGGTEKIRLANFTARIKKEIFKDDGQTYQLMFEVDGILAGGRSLPEISVPSGKFPSMSWPVEHWGAAANIYPGTSNRDNMRHAIQSTGFNSPKITEFTHTGWRKINDSWVYLHSGGAIGADGIIVNLTEAQLTNYCLPPVTNLQEAAKTTLQCLTIAPPEVTYPLLATIFLAPLCEPMRQANCEPSFILWLSGISGVRKSTLAGLFLSHFGNFAGKSLPANFRDTENTLERKGFLLKDSVLIVDDYCPQGSINEKRAMERKAHSLIRGYGDRIGRGRMNADTSLRQSHIPRGLCIVTGEDVPNNLGQSAIARLLNIELQRGQIDLNLLTQIQGQAHLLVQTMSGYIEWIIQRMDYLVVEYKKMFPAFRVKAATENTHGRIPEAVANLYLGMAALFSYFEDIGIVSEAQKQEELMKTWNILIGLAKNQGYAVSEDSPTELFLSALQELITARQVIIRGITDTDESGENEKFIGWKDNFYYYLLPGLAYKAICQFYQQQGGIFGVGERTLWKHLEEAGKIRVTKDSRQTNRTIPKEIPILGKQIKVLWMKREVTF